MSRVYYPRVTASCTLTFDFDVCDVIFISSPFCLLHVPFRFPFRFTDFTSALISQLVYTFGGSAFEGGNGSMMIEVVVRAPACALRASDSPTAILSHAGRRYYCACRRRKPPCRHCYYHGRILSQFHFDWTHVFVVGRVPAWGHYRLLPEAHPGGVYRRSGRVPHRDWVSYSCAVGLGLIRTSLEVAAGINDEGGFQYNLDTFKLYFMNRQNLILWVPAFALAVLLRIITHKVNHQLVFPMCQSLGVPRTGLIGFQTLL